MSFNVKSTLIISCLHSLPLQDRILFRSNFDGDIEGMKYFSSMDIKDSDHKPVGAIFRVILAPSKHMER